MGPKPSPIRVDGATHLRARRLAAFRAVIRRFALSIGRSCCCFTALLSCRLPCCHVTCPVVVSPALLSFGPSGCQFTHPVLVRPFTLVVGFHLGVAVLSLCRGLRSIVMAILAVPSSPSWLHRCCHRRYIVVALLSLSWLRQRRPGCMVTVARKRWRWEEGGKWGWWKTREGRK